MISNVIEKLGRAIFEAPFGGGRISKDAPELAEIRLAVLDAVKSKSHRAGGKSVFPFNLIRIQFERYGRIGLQRQRDGITVFV